jgi:hypothetical protein
LLPRLLQPKPCCCLLPCLLTAMHCAAGGQTLAAGSWGQQAAQGNKSPAQLAKSAATAGAAQQAECSTQSIQQQASTCQGACKILQQSQQAERRAAASLPPPAAAAAAATFQTGTSSSCCRCGSCL